MGLKSLLFNEPAPEPRNTVPSVMEAARFKRAPVAPTNVGAVEALKKRVIPPAGPLAVFLSITASLAKFIPDSSARTAAALETLTNQGSSKEMLAANIEDAKDNLARERSGFATARNQRMEREVLVRRKDADTMGAELSRLREQISKIEAEQSGLRAAAEDAEKKIEASSAEFDAAANSVAAQLEELKSQI